MLSYLTDDVCPLNGISSQPYYVNGPSSRAHNLSSCSLIVFIILSSLITATAHRHRANHCQYALFSRN